ncbi:hypothetical protein GUJ93_ZPchr0009g794 [Zizania palustris]|uniref:Uncharacterized protein n=1 Tax=Zizania palustris TaxID=103762 RepID=A0A8J5RQZ7_ZIZPA|nr:hypothetical protein GUJ93_ZPchr0009g794 [Zizania palustris]
MNLETRIFRTTLPTACWRPSPPVSSREATPASCFFRRILAGESHAGVLLPPHPRRSNSIVHHVSRTPQIRNCCVMLLVTINCLWTMFFHMLLLWFHVKSRECKKIICVVEEKNPATLSDFRSFCTCLKDSC